MHDHEDRIARLEQASVNAEAALTRVANGLINVGRVLDGLERTVRDLQTTRQYNLQLRRKIEDLEQRIRQLEDQANYYG